MKDTFVKKDLHPFRYRASRKFVSDFLNIYRKYVGPEMWTPNHMNIFQPKFIELYQREIIKVPVNQRSSQVASVINHELSMFMHYAKFHTYGQNIFRPTPYLVELLKHTNISDVVLSDLKFPFKSFYLSFGNTQTWTLGDPSNKIDGAYIQVNSGGDFGHDWRSVEIVLTSYNGNDFKLNKNFLENPNIYYYFILKYEASEKKTIQELLQESLAEEFKDISNQNFDLSKLETPEVEDTSFFDNFEIESYSPFFTTQVAINEDGKYILEKTKEPSSEFVRRKFVRENFDTFTSVLKLIINLICYVSAEPEDQNEVYPADAPPTKVESYEQASSQASKRRTEQQLQNQGFTRIKIIGKKFDPEAQAIYKSSDQQIKGEKSVHWRRGHWRSQPYGTQRDEKKLIFIKPMLIRGDKGMPEKGHIYTIESREGN